MLLAEPALQSHCQRCNKTVTEDEVWVNALDKTFHKALRACPWSALLSAMLAQKCFTCVDCNCALKLDAKYFDKNGQPQVLASPTPPPPFLSLSADWQCPKCEREGQDQCAGCNKVGLAWRCAVAALSVANAGCSHLRTRRPTSRLWTSAGTRSASSAPAAARSPALCAARCLAPLTCHHLQKFALANNVEDRKQVVLV